MQYGIEVFWSGVPQSWAFLYQIEQCEINLYLGDGGQKKYIAINLLCPTACHCGYRHSVDLLGKEAWRCLLFSPEQASFLSLESVPENK